MKAYQTTSGVGKSSRGQHARRHRQSTLKNAVLICVPFVTVAKPTGEHLSYTKGSRSRVETLNGFFEAKSSLLEVINALPLKANFRTRYACSVFVILICINFGLS